MDLDIDTKYAYGNPINKHNKAETIPIHNDLKIIFHVFASFTST
ncbi:Hypothetical protein MCYN_0688 [Mycoplasmopsis cynos C142]|uniref:Uncharacterized protein n=1 Tax=Mycoplasmopsis cynos (strain C142) TaxID=1246955 RepID=L0RY29_MYCC1|nr:Hypothetical protein MCYN_0688 [Mycoplasmopsis cynos C142]